MERLNSEGIFRDDLIYALKTRRLVMIARRTNTCLLCRCRGVNETGLCEACYSQLNPEEARLAEAWLRGEGP